MECPKYPPWEPLHKHIHTDLLNPITKAENPEHLKAEALRTIHIRFKHHLKIYTDGSKLSNNNGATSTTAGYYVEGRNKDENDILNIRHYWKLHPDITIAGAELS